MKRLGVLVLLIAALSSANAADVKFHVDVTQDAPDYKPGDGICSALPSTLPTMCTLRAAVMEANATTIDMDLVVDIYLSKGLVYPLTIAGAFEQSSETGDLDLLRPMFIGVTNGEDHARIQNVATGDRVFHLTSAAHGTIIQRVDIVGGEAENGCAIYSKAPGLELLSVNIYNNCLADPVGHNYAVVSTASAKLNRSSIHHNQGGNVCCGYAISASGAGTELTIERSSVYSNMSSVTGAAILAADDVHLVMADSTVSHNGNALAYGLFITDDATADVRNSTIVFNGIVQIRHSSSQGMSMANSIVLAGPDAYACDLSLSGSQLAAIGWSIFSDATCADSVSGVGNQHGATFAEMKLEELGFWGGGTKNHLPEVGSIAIDRTPAEFCAPSSFDQRGFGRVVSYDGSFPARCDTGAVEVAAGPVDHFVEGFRDGFESDYCGFCAKP